MTLPWRLGRGAGPTIRVRLGAALALALLPVLILGAVQSTLTFQREARERQTNLEAASLRSAATVRARLESAEILLQTLAPGSVGLECAQRLSQVSARIPGYTNLIRFDSIGRVACSSGAVPADAERRGAAWFTALRDGERMRIVRQEGGADDSILAAVRAEDAGGAFDGALVALIELRSLRPDVADRSLPQGSEIALADAGGDYLTSSRPSAFPTQLGGRLSRIRLHGSSVWTEADRVGARRMYSAAPITDNDTYVVISAPLQGIYTWALLNPLTTLALPILAFSMALAAVWVVAERGVLRWISYLQRIAAIYARGRFSVHPLQAERAPPEFRDLALTLDEMANTIATRDASLLENLAQKDDLMREIHHRVKNNLQIISSLLNMQQRALADPAARAAMTDTRQRITALSLIYRSLYQGPDLRTVDLRDFLEELIAALVLGEGHSADKVQTEVHADSLTMDADHLPPLALFAVEAITNARKHGFSEEGGLLRVNFVTDEREAVLTIADCGSGRGPPEVGKGVGRTLMTAFARQLRGEVKFLVNEAGGLTAQLTFPIPVGHSGQAAPAAAPESRNSAAAEAL